MPTRPGLAVAVGAIAAAAAGRLFGVTELFVLAGIAGALLVVALVWVRRPVGQLDVERRVTPNRLVAGGVGRVELTVANQGRRRIPPIALVDPVAGTVGARLSVGPLGRGARQSVGYRLPPLRRGPVSLGPLAIEVVDPFGLARRRLAGPPAEVPLVLPAIDPAPPLPLGDGRHEPLTGLSRRTSSASGTQDLVTLRPYVVGDDLRRVHWPSTAHADELQVRRDEEHWQGHFTVYLDTRTDGLDPADFERAVSAAAGIVDAVTASGDRIRLTTATGTDSGMVDAVRTGHGLLEELALVRQSPDAAAVPAADPRRPATVVVLTGDRPGDLTAQLHDAGFARTVVVSFAASAAGSGADVSVPAGTTFAEAWTRAAAAEAVR